MNVLIFLIPEGKRYQIYIWDASRTEQICQQTMEHATGLWAQETRGVGDVHACVGVQSQPTERESLHWHTAEPPLITCGVRS